MSKREKGFSENGNGIKPKHFIYLDRNRLFSYVSQLSDGLPTVRNLLDAIGDSATETPTEIEKRGIIEESGEGNVKGSLAAVQAGGKKSRKKEKTKAVRKTDGPTKTYNSLNLLSQSKIEHDNLYIALETDLINSGLITEINNKNFGEDNLSCIVKISSYASFIDPELISDMTFNKTINWEEGLKEIDNPEEKESIIKDTVELYSSFYRNSIGLNLKISNKKILVSLNREYLYITVEQLRSIYMTKPSTYLTVIGHFAKKGKERVNNKSIIEIVDFSSAIETITGTIDFTIEPLAIYT